jgi:MFS-type transporter involved in bile tolerance (Atg22 family)
MYFARPCYIIPPDFRSLMNVDLYDDTSIILLDFEVYVLWVCIMSIALVKHQVKKKNRHAKLRVYFVLFIIFQNFLVFK